MNTVETLFNSREASDVLRLSERTLRRLVADGEISTIKVGRRRLYPAVSLQEFVDRRKAAGAK